MRRGQPPSCPRFLKEDIIVTMQSPMGWCIAMFTRKLLGCRPTKKTCQETIAAAVLATAPGYRVNHLRRVGFDKEQKAYLRIRHARQAFRYHPWYHK